MEAKWISVKERCPETLSMLAGESDTVLVHYYSYGSVDSYGEAARYDVVTMGFYCADGRWKACDNNRWGQGDYPK